MPTLLFLASFLIFCYVLTYVFASKEDYKQYKAHKRKVKKAMQDPTHDIWN